MYTLKIFCVCLVFSLPVFSQSETPTSASVEEEMNHALELKSQGNIDEALIILRKLLPQAEKLKDTLLTAKLYANVGFTLQALNPTKEGYVEIIDYSEKSAELFKQLNDTISLGHIYNNIGACHEKLEQNSEAIHYYQLSIDYSQSSVGKVFPYSNIAFQYLELDSLDLAKEKFLVSNYHIREVFSAIENGEDVIVPRVALEDRQATNYHGLTSVEIKNQRYKKAGNYNLSAFKIANTLNNSPLKEALLKNQFSIDSALNNPDKAYTSLLNLISLKDSINLVDQLKVYKDFEKDFELRLQEEKLELTEEKNLYQKGLITILLVFAFLLVGAIIYILFINKKLKKAKEDAEQLSKAKVKMYSEISHELRTPLYSIIELINLFKKNNLNPQQKEDLTSLQFSSNYLLKLVNNVLEFNKKDFVEDKVEDIAFSVSDIINNIANSYRYLLNEQYTKLVVDIDETIPSTLIGDSPKLSQILVNLIFNAIKFTKKGTITVSAKKVSESPTNTSIAFKVVDTGIGIAKENQELIFKKFYQETEAKNTNLKGTGLGLSIVAKFLKLLGSEIHLTSELHKGTEFSFTIAFKNTEQQNTSEIKTRKNQLENCDILIVDDNALNLKITERVLKNNGAKCITAINGRQAIEKTKTWKFCCILMDVNMPELNGYETSKEIRKQNPDIPIILLSASPEEDIDITNDINGIITKPYIHSVFIDKVSKEIKKYKFKTAQTKQVSINP